MPEPHERAVCKHEWTTIRPDVQEAMLAIGHKKQPHWFTGGRGPKRCWKCGKERT